MVDKHCGLSIPSKKRMITTQKIEQLIKEKITDAEVHVLDPHNDGSHFESIVVSATFEDKSLVQQHQMVMNALRDQFADALHALALKTFTPAKWEQERQKYNL